MPISSIAQRQILRARMSALRSLVQRVFGRHTLTPQPDRCLDDDPFAEVWKRCAPHTMTSIERGYALWEAVRYVHCRGIPGDIAECGVWKGGSAMIAALALEEVADEHRRIFLYDTFEGMSEPTARDIGVLDGRPVRNVWQKVQEEPDGLIMARAPIELVRANMSSTDIGPDRTVYVKGKVEDTIPGVLPGALSVLRLDTDWYESTQHELKHLWPLLSPGGVLIVDDYGHWAGARDAVDEYFAERSDAPFLSRLDYTGRLGIRPFVDGWGDDGRLQGAR